MKLFRFQRKEIEISISNSLKYILSFSVFLTSTKTWFAKTDKYNAHSVQSGFEWIINRLQRVEL